LHGKFFNKLIGVPQMCSKWVCGNGTC